MKNNRLRMFATCICSFLIVSNPLFAIENPVSGEASDPASAPAGAPGVVKGRVVDTSHEVLPGAAIYVNEIQTGTVSDVNGFYVLPNLKPGKYTIRISYVGYTTKEIGIEITSNDTEELDIVLDEGVELSEVSVSCPFFGQRGAINSQRTSMAAVNVVSADQVGKFPDSNIGDALKRINGINVQYDQGEARFGQVRGTSADMSSVTVNGNRLPSAEGDTRNVQLDLIPADMVQTIEVNKVVSSDMDGDAIGGAINLVTKNTPYRRTLNITAGTGYNMVSEKPQLNLGITYGNRFAHNKLGLMLAASYQYAPGGSDNTEFEYEEGDEEVEFKEAQVRQYYVTRERQSYSASLDYDLNPDHKISFKGIYNRRNDWENRYRISYKKLNSKASKQSIVIQTKAGDSDNKDARLERQQTMDFTLDGEHVFGNLHADWAVSYGRASEDRPEERYFAVAIEGIDYGSTFVDVGKEQPYSTQALPGYDSEDWEIDELTNANQSISEDEWKFRLNFEWQLAQGLFGNKLKFGGKYVNKTKERETHCFDYVDAYEEMYGDQWKQHLKGQIRSGFLAGDNYPEGTLFIDKEYVGSIDFSKLEGEEVLEEASGNYSATERIGSAYIRFDQRLGEKLDATIGLRMENTSLTYGGFNWVIDEEGDESLIATGDHDNDYTNWLPSLLLKYNVSDDFKVRAAITRTLSRPKYAALIPCVHYSIQDEEATIGNPELDPMTSTNVDFNIEYYFKSVGLASAGFFYKSVQDVIVDEVWKGEAAEVPASIGGEYEITKTINAYDADLFGIEVAYQRDFGFIAPALRSVGFYGTYTYTHSKTKNYNFMHREDPNPDNVTMAGSPEHTANASLYYENKGISARLSYNFASDFIDEMGEIAELDRYYDKASYLDLNLSYTWGNDTRFTVYADATNLLNQPLRYYQGVSDRTAQSEYYGVRLSAGLKVNF